MNVGQILETHLGWAGKILGFQAITPVFDGASEEDINQVLDDAGLPRHGKAQLFDGRTGDAFDRKVTVGIIYMLSTLLADLLIAVLNPRIRLETKR